MKDLTKNTEALIRNSIDVATSLGIETMVIDSISLRGQNIDNGIILIKYMKDEKLEFDAIGLGRLPALKNRLNVFTNPVIKYDLQVNDGTSSTVSKLKISEGRSNVTFKCHAPNLIKAAKGVNDPDYCKLEFTSDDVKTLLRGVGIIENTAVNLTVNDGVAALSVSEKEGDAFTHELLTEAVYSTSKDDIITKNYKSRILKVIFSNYIKKDDSANPLVAHITGRGILRFDILDMNIYLFPER